MQTVTLRYIRSRARRHAKGTSLYRLAVRLEDWEQAAKEVLQHRHRTKLFVKVVEIVLARHYEASGIRIIFKGKECGQNDKARTRFPKSKI